MLGSQARPPQILSVQSLGAYSNTARTRCGDLTAARGRRGEKDAY